MTPPRDVEANGTGARTRSGRTVQPHPQRAGTRPSLTGASNPDSSQHGPQLRAVS
ncbi:hypothetical protein [Streptomyces iconiensis]|uniref:Uncharacterized protein n=1 Tax=Streptomyces iconiensis TaxID=1384038 RepID=A0ABT7A7K9_9ACTN|nr:hypothetical protein [Streptomyces iconiensis]MDJ1137305.1 hypothetical protein [Streptomyces iconiensis]